MLEHKGIDYKRVDLIAALHRPLLRARGFKSSDGPGAHLDGPSAASPRPELEFGHDLRPVGFALWTSDAHVFAGVSTGATGLEPAASGVTGRRSNQLSYAPEKGC